MTSLIEHNGMRLVRIDGKGPVHVDDVLVSNRGDQYVAKGGSAPHRDGSTGRIYVVPHDAVDASQTGYFPSVFDCEWVEVA